MAFNQGSWPHVPSQDQAPPAQDRRRSFNSWTGSMPQAGVAFTNPFGQQQPDLHLNTQLPHTYHHQHDSAATPTPFGEPIKHWDGREAPWSVASLTAPSLDTGLGQQQHSAFTTPRSPARSASTASAMGPPPIDSAYCSNASPTTNEPATAGSDCPEITDMFGRWPRGFSNPSTSPSTPVKSNSRRAPTSVPSNADDNMTLPDDMKCPFCQRQHRLKSELKKHMLRHTRPFRCRIPGCAGLTEGFTTSNDLDRHNRSVHSIFPKGAKVYICAAKNCAEGEKTWPRYDNFKQHCERMHKQDVLETLIRNSERPAPPPTPDVQQYLQDYEKKSGSSSGRKRTAMSDSASMVGREAPGYNTNTQVSAFYDWDYNSVSDTVSWPGYHTNYNSGELSDDPSTRVAQKQVRNHIQGRRLGPGDNASLSSARMSSRSGSHKAPQIILHQANDAHKQRQNELAHMQQFDQSQPDDTGAQFQTFMNQQGQPASQPTGPLLTPNMARSRSLSSQSSSSSLSKSFRGRAATISGGDASRGKRKQDGAGTSSGSAKRVCCTYPGCNKADMRRCELKKHVRRHTRPFGCTFDGCHKAFGSKNDWKRHESSQHFQDEIWRCDQVYTPANQPMGDSSVMTLSQSDCETSSPCAMVFYDYSEIAAHLADKHAFTDDAEIERVCEQVRIGRNLCGSFWCGFCKQVRQLEHEGRKGWNERFDHIGHHFHPEGKNIKDWVPPIGNKTKEQLLVEKQRAKVEYDSEGRSGGDDGSDNDGLGEPELDIELTASPVDVTSSADIASFPSPMEMEQQFDPNVMDGIQFAPMGPLQQPPPLELNTMNIVGDSANPQLPSPATSGSHEACERRQRFGSPDGIYCCHCGDGPMRGGGGCACMTCGHTC